MDNIQKYSHENWMQIPELTRNDCVNCLKGWIYLDNIKIFKTQLESGQPIGGPGFHLFGGGMQVRNRLRSQLLDEELPGVKYEDGKLYKNWDDYYMGALQELVEKTT